MAATCFLFLVAIALFFPTLFKPDIAIYKGDICYFFPHEVVIRNSLDQGDFPLWNPYFGGGSPNLSRLQVRLFYPLLVLLRFIEPIVARLNWDVAVNVFIAGPGVYWLMRDLVTRRTAALPSSVPLPLCFLAQSFPLFSPGMLVLCMLLSSLAGCCLPTGGCSPAAPGITYCSL